MATMLDRLEKKYAWSLLGFVLAIVLGALTIYTDFFRNPKPHLRFEIVSDASVLDVREKLGNLEILYDGEDIQKAQKSLRVVILRIINDGSQDILKDHFDEKAPVGFRVERGSLVRAELLGGSNSYLFDVARLDLQHQNSASLAPLILEAGEWITIKSLILHSEGARPTLLPLGKVAGVREIKLVDSSESINEPGFLDQAFQGGIWIQVVRLFSYFLAFVIGFIAFVVPLTYLSGKWATHKRIQCVKRFKERTHINLTNADEFIFSSYIKRDVGYLVALRRLVEDEGKLRSVMARFEQAEIAKLSESSPDMNDIDDYLGVSSTGAPLPTVWRRSLARQIVDGGFVVKSADGWHVDSHQAATLAEFAEFVETSRNG